MTAGSAPKKTLPMVLGILGAIEQSAGDAPARRPPALAGGGRVVDPGPTPIV